MHVAGSPAAQRAMRRGAQPRAAARTAALLCSDSALPCAPPPRCCCTVRVRCPGVWHVAVQPVAGMPARCVHQGVAHRCPRVLLQFEPAVLTRPPSPAGALQGSMEGWGHFIKDMRQWYGVDMDCLSGKFKEEQREYFLTTSQWADIHPSQQLGPAALYKSYDLHTLTLEELKVGAWGAACWLSVCLSCGVCLGCTRSPWRSSRGGPGALHVGCPSV
jgi:hypothetical protein